MSLCDRCYAPGACCKGLVLSKGEGATPFTSWLSDSPEQVLENLKAFNENTVDQEISNLMIFDSFMEQPEYRYHDQETGQDYAVVRLRCTKLLPDGRCGIYENRPKLCRDYQPLEDQLCVHFKGAESGDPTVQ